MSLLTGTGISSFGFQLSNPPSLLLSICSTPVCSLYLEPLSKWCLASLTADWSGLSALLSLPFPFPFLRLLTPIYLAITNFRPSSRWCLISLTADWSGLSALPSSPAPHFPCLVGSLELSSGFSGRRLVRIVRLPPEQPNCCPITGALELLAFGFSDRRLVRISVACIPIVTLTQKWKLRFWLLTSQGRDVYHSLDGTTYSTASCTIMG